jgi:hypothetical protein
MRVCRYLILVAAAAAMSGCARQPAPQYAQYPGMRAYAASPQMVRSDLDEMTYGAPAYRQPPRAYGPPPGYRPAYGPPPGYRPAYAPQPSYGPPPAAVYRPPPVAYVQPPPPSYPMRHVTQYVPVRELPEDNGPYTLDTGDKFASWCSVRTRFPTPTPSTPPA